MQELVEIWRAAIDAERLYGFVLARSDQLMLINPINPDYMAPNGYCAIRNSDITRWRVLKSESFMARAMALKGASPSPNERIATSSWPELLRSATDLYPLITIHQEALDRQVCYIGRLCLLSDRSFSLKEIDSRAKWRKSARRYYFRNLTKVDFGGGYEDALWRVAEGELTRSN